MARGLDVIGSRWTLLIVRELLLGQKRYTDLLQALPAIGTNTLSDRLKELEAAELVKRRSLAPPTAVTVFELTERGAEIRDIIDVIGRWGTPLLARPSNGDEVRTAWLLLCIAATTGPERLEAVDDGTYQANVDEETFRLTVANRRLTAEQGQATHPTATITTDRATLWMIATTDATRAVPLEITGNRDAANRLVHALQGVMASANLDA